MEFQLIVLGCFNFLPFDSPDFQKAYGDNTCRKMPSLSSALVPITGCYHGPFTIKE